MVQTGCVDLQVNGYAGTDFSSVSLSLDKIITLTRLLAELGTSAFLPTVVTSPPEVYDHVLPLLAEAIDHEKTHRRLLGIHLEGPFISPKEGAVGAHPAEHVALPDPSELDRLIDLSRGKIRLLTVAPERPGAIKLIAHAKSCGIMVAIGHTLADHDTIRRAADAGATLSTHLGNGVPQMIHRHDNPILAQLAEPRLTAMLITDGHHLPDDFIRIVLKIKGPEQTIVTSDSAAIAGLSPGEYPYLGTRVRLDTEGRISLVDRPGLAGSGSTMRMCVDYLDSLDLVSKEDLVRITRYNPLLAIGLGQPPAKSSSSLSSRG